MVSPVQTVVKESESRRATARRCSARPPVSRGAARTAGRAARPKIDGSRLPG